MFTSCPRSVRIASWLFVLAPALFVPGRSPGQEVPGEGGDAAREAVQVALRGTLSTGRPTVLVATSRTSPESLDLWRRLMGAYGAPWISSMQWLEVSADRDPVWLVKLGITDIPSVIVFGRGPTGLEFLGRLNRPKGVEEVAAWLAPLSTVRPAREAGDPAVTRAQYSTPQALPSSQAALPPPPPQLPPVQMPPPPSAAVAVPTATAVPVQPVYSAPSQSPVSVALPSTPIMIQPSSPTVLIGAAPPPTVMAVSSAAPSQPVAAPTVAMPAASPPVVMALTQSATAQPMPVAALANPAAPAMAAAAPMAQPTAAAAATPALLLSQPNLIDRLLGAIGRCLASRARPRVELVQMPALATVPMATQPTLMAPAPPAQPAYSLPSQPVYAAPPPEQARPLASPQSPPPQHRWHLFHRD